MKVILFDGVCNLCNGLVNWIIDRDKQSLFKFSTLQSAFGKTIIEKYAAYGNMNTIILLDEENVFTRSTAVLRVLKYLGGIYSFAYVFILIPPFVRNLVYEVIAKNRYRWFGKRDTCRIPVPELKAKFLE